MAKKDDDYHNMHLKGKIFGITRIYKITIEIHRRAKYRHSVFISNLGGSQYMEKMAIILPTGQWYAPSAVINVPWYCMVLHGIAWYCIVLHGIT